MQLRAGQRVGVVVNGERTESWAVSLAELVTELGFSGDQVATALNGDFVPRQARATTGLAAGDKIEIVAPRQGG
jgi:sulfur carrier protein